MKTSEFIPPTDDKERWERGLSPWHEDAFPDEFKQQAPEHGERKSGWYELDSFQNQIGFVPDGTEIIARRALADGKEGR